jgi:hypothetical protein
LRNTAKGHVRLIDGQLLLTLDLSAGVVAHGLQPSAMTCGRSAMFDRSRSASLVAIGDPAHGGSTPL